jgi:hypothetical protein
MDTNYILSREQISLVRAKTALSPEARCAHSGLARGYATILAARGFPNRVATTGCGRILPR